jgi:hypothetical protein
MLKQLQFFVLFCCMLGASTSFAMIPRLCTLPSGMVGNGLKIIKPRTVLPKTIKRNCIIEDIAVMLVICGALSVGLDCLKLSPAMQEKTDKHSPAIGSKYHLIDGVYVMVAKEYESGMKERASTKYPLYIASENDQNLIKFVKDALVVDPLKSAVTNIVIFIFAPRIQPYKTYYDIRSRSCVDLGKHCVDYVRVLIENNIDDSKGVRIVCVSLPAEPCFS